MRTVFVEIIAKKKGCMLCDLAIAVLEEIAPGFPAGTLRWEVVDVGTREGLARLDQLTRTAGSKPSVPSIVIDQGIAFDHIPDYDRLHAAVSQALKASEAPGT